MRIVGAVLLLCLGVSHAEADRSASSPPPLRPNIIVITLDTTRADRMGFLGSSRGLTPNLDGLAKQAIIFSRAYAQVPLTTPSHANIFTGTYPQFNHLVYMGEPLTADLPYLPDIFHHRGYRTAAFVGSVILDSKNPLAAGFGRGFDTFDAPFHRRAKHEDRYASVERRAELVVDRALAWLGSHPKGPFFLWIHCYDPHAPYDPPEPYKTRYVSQPYDGEIAYTDSAIGKLLRALRSRGLYDRSLIAVMADHGEALGEHGEHHHGIFLYDETIHVPLVFKLPRQRFAGRVFDNRVELVDVAPTILEEAGIPKPSMMQGISLINPGRTNASVATADRPAYAETDYAHRAFGWSALRSWRTGKYLYVDAPQAELYDQATDPGSLHNIALDAKAVAQTMQEQSEQFHEKMARGEGVKPKLDPEQGETLRALGYVGTDSSSIGKGERGADPKGKTDLADLLDQALVSIQDEEFEAAIPKLQEVLKAEPNTPIAYLELGRAYVYLKQPQEALPFLRTAVEKIPEDGMARFMLGRAFVETGDWGDAVPQFEAAISHTPDSPDLHFDLAVSYQRLQRIPEAMREFQEIIKLQPKHFRANLLLGRLLGMQGKGAEALPYLQSAVTIDPKSIEAHMFLANVYAGLGETKKADRERNEVDRLKEAP